MMGFEIMIEEAWYYPNKFEICKAYKELYLQHGATHLVTFIFNLNQPNIAWAANMLNTWHRKTDKDIYGHSFYKRQRHERTSFIAMVEHPNANLHYHAFLKTPHKARFELIAPLIWEDLVPGGELHLGNPEIDDEQRAKWGTYTTKELMFGNNIDSIFISKANPGNSAKLH